MKLIPRFFRTRALKYMQDVASVQTVLRLLSSWARGENICISKVRFEAAPVFESPYLVSALSDTRYTSLAYSTAEFGSILPGKRCNDVLEDEEANKVGSI